MTTSRSLERRGAFTLSCITAMLAIALAMWFIAINAAAAEVASDNELYAAYCIGVLQQRLQGQRELYLKIEQDFADDKQAQDDYKRALEEDAKDLNQKLSRFRTYLAVRGFRPEGGRDPQAFTGIQVARQRGRADVQQCNQFHEKTCSPRCRANPDALIQGLDPNVITKCIDQCRAENAACRSSERCLQADNLPF